MFSVIVYGLRTTFRKNNGDDDCDSDLGTEQKLEKSIVHGKITITVIQR